MSTTTTDLSGLTSSVLARSAEFAQRIQKRMPSILVDTGHYSTDAFLLRSFVSLRGDNQGEELALSIDITAPSIGDVAGSISITSDLCWDDGTIVVTGPSAKLDPAGPSFEKMTAMWTRDFDAFLIAAESEALNELNALIANLGNDERGRSIS